MRWNRSLPLLYGALLLLGACAARQERPAVRQPVETVAVLPIQRESPRRGMSLPGSEEEAPVPAEASRTATAQIYAVLTERSDVRFVPDLTVRSLLESSAVPRAGDLLERARALGKAAQVDAVLFGSIWRFHERVGTQYGAREPAAVSLRLNLFDTRSGEVIWTGEFEETQEALTSNLLNAWMFWRAGPRWFSASELTRLGVERLIDDMTDEVIR